MRLWLRNENPPELRRAPSFLKAFLRALTVVGLPLLVLAPFASVGGAAPHHGLTPVATALPNSRLTAGATLVGSSSLVSPNGQYRLDMEADGNLVLYREGRPLWASGTSGHPGTVAAMQGDGNFVIYQGHRAIWSSNTSRGGNSAYYLVVLADGNVVIYTPANRPIWATNTSDTGTRTLPSSAAARSSLNAAHRGGHP